MVDTKETKPNKGTITEEDVSTLLQRYSAMTVLSLLKEVSQFVNVKVDWQGLMKRTETGIKSVREYQMLWRHLAYRQPLIDNIGPNDQLLDDDSDLEYELEAYPLVSTVDATEASNCVKVLTSGSVNKSRMPNSSSCVVPRASSEYQQAQKRVQAAGPFGEGLVSNGSTSKYQKIRKLCSGEKDLEPIAIRKGEFNGERNTTQRPQRGNYTRKKQGSSNIGKLSDAQLATRHALDMALKDNPSTGCGTVKISTSERKLTLGSSSKLLSSKKAPPQSNVIVDSIQATAVAAGARIASHSDAESLFKAAKSKNAVHIQGSASTAGN